MKLHVGTSGYAYKEWKGLFYPERIDPGEMLRFYGERLNAVEINYTFYHMPTERLLESWAAQVPQEFVFTFKAPRVITHRKRLRGVGEEVAHYFRTLAPLGGKLGAVLFQFPANFRADLPRLEEFLDLIPPGARCAFGFRSPTWGEAGVAELLRGRGFCLCVEDADEVPAGEIVSTAPWGYLRLRRSDYSEADLAGWGERVNAQGWERAFVFFKHEEEAKGPGEAVRFGKLASSAVKAP